MTEFEQVEQQIIEVNRKVTSILHLLSGNELDPGTGLVNKVKELQTENKDLKGRVLKLEELKKKIIWVAAGIAFPTCYGASSLIYKFVKSIIGS